LRTVCPAERVDLRRTKYRAVLCDEEVSDLYRFPSTVWRVTYTSDVMMGWARNAWHMVRKPLRKRQHCKT